MTKRIQKMRTSGIWIGAVSLWLSLFPADVVFGQGPSEEVFASIQTSLAPCEKISPRELRRLYRQLQRSSKYDKALGYRLGEKTSLSFFLTNAAYPPPSPGGLTHWKMIESFLHDLPEATWLESGWKGMRNGIIHHVKLSYRSSQCPMFGHYFFFSLNQKWVIGQFLCPATEVSNYEELMENTTSALKWSLVTQHPLVRTP